MPHGRGGTRMRASQLAVQYMTPDEEPGNVAMKRGAQFMYGYAEQRRRMADGSYATVWSQTELGFSIGVRCGMQLTIGKKVSPAVHLTRTVSERIPNLHINMRATEPSVTSTSQRRQAMPAVASMRYMVQIDYAPLCSTIYVYGAARRQPTGGCCVMRVLSSSLNMSYKMLGLGNNDPLLLRPSIDFETFMYTVSLERYSQMPIGAHCVTCACTCTCTCPAPAPAPAPAPQGEWRTAQDPSTGRSLFSFVCACDGLGSHL